MAEPLRFCIADPPYLGRSVRWYGDGGCGVAHGKGQADNHPEAWRWDLPETHKKLVKDLETKYDGWAIAMSVHSLSTYLSVINTDSRNGIRTCVWHKPNAVTSGSRITNRWEPVIIKVPSSRRGHHKGLETSDVLICPPPQNGFMGSKPAEWTQWVIDLMGATDDDCIDDLFLGSGAVSAALKMQRLPFQ